MAGGAAEASKARRGAGEGSTPEEERQGLAKNWRKGRKDWVKGRAGGRKRKSKVSSNDKIRQAGKGTRSRNL